MVTDKHYAALDQVLELAVLINDDMTRSLAQDGLTVSRTHLLWELRRRGPVTQRDLADALKVSARTVTGLVDGLEATGFVSRQPHPTDRRATLVTFTERGVRTVEEMERGQQEFARLLFGEMTQERLDCFSGALDEILTRLRAASQTYDPRGGDQ
ncbi:MarR family winged helix-turn-helix transcriptional regulator [Plantactinospora soyae]|uniref:DNA-binding MarR family transcriptional regulator n=1 Tax=Plantactinospora soyae TaxID=1544732 RepID=A0A927M9I2_9ACTN|nr:MarR family transcriptional regulator [Plantactinospora soyae]MBE1489066.1 DNA-binding MarR family transcriptional regulator [Plantactinospora soyae]